MKEKAKCDQIDRGIKLASGDMTKVEYEQAVEAEIDTVAKLFISVLADTGIEALVGAYSRGEITHEAYVDALQETARWRFESLLPR